MAVTCPDMEQVPGLLSGLTWRRGHHWDPWGPQVQVQGRQVRGCVQVSAGCCQPTPRCGPTSHSTERACGENTFPNK